MNEKAYLLRKDIPHLCKEGEVFYLRDGFFVNTEETVSIKSDDNSAKLFRYEKR